MNLPSGRRDAPFPPMFYLRRGPIGRTLIEAVALLIVVAGLGMQIATLPFGKTFLASEANVRAIGGLFGAADADARQATSDAAVRDWLENLPFTPEAGAGQATRSATTDDGSGSLPPRQTPSEAIPSLTLPVLLVALLIGIIVFPLLEELVFRGLPILGLRVLQRRGRFNPQQPVRVFGRAIPGHWLFGVLAAVLFSLMHGIGDDALRFPVPQFVAGLAFWWVAFHRGLRYSMLMHATYNIIPLGAVAVSVALG